MASTLITIRRWMRKKKHTADADLAYYEAHKQEIGRLYRDRWIVIHDQKVTHVERWQDTLWQQRDTIPVGSLTLNIDDDGYVRPPSLGRVVWARSKPI